MNEILFILLLFVLIGFSFYFLICKNNIDHIDDWIARKRSNNRKLGRINNKLKLMVFIVFCLLVFIIITVSDSLSFYFLFYISIVLNYLSFPFFVLFNYIDIIIVSSIIFAIISVVAFLFFKKIYIFIGIFLMFLVASYMETSLYINNVAKRKYGVKPLSIHINFSRFTNFTPCIGGGCGGRYEGEHHAEIIINNQIYHWSFKKRDFVLK